MQLRANALNLVDLRGNRVAAHVPVGSPRRIECGLRRRPERRLGLGARRREPEAAARRPADAPRDASGAASVGARRADRRGRRLRYGRPRTAAQASSASRPGRAASRAASQSTGPTGSGSRTAAARSGARRGRYRPHRPTHRARRAPDRGAPRPGGSRTGSPSSTDGSGPTRTAATCARSIRSRTGSSLRRRCRAGSATSRSTTASG